MYVRSRFLKTKNMARGKLKFIVKTYKFVTRIKLISDDIKSLSVKFQDSHIYYSSWRQTGPEYGKHYWVDMSNRTDVVIQPTLSNSHRRAVVSILIIF